MSKRARGDDVDREEEVLRAIRLIRGGPATRAEADGLSLTPLEKQVVALKEAVPPHVVLLVACGYRVKLYGRDSRVISRRSGIMCIPAQPFEYSSVPYFRVELYIRRLVAMGYHVGFADQESAAVRAVEGVKSGVFQRTVSQLYSRGTLLPDEHVATSGSSGGGGTADGDDEAGDEGGAEGSADKLDWSAGPSSGAGAGASELFLCFVAPSVAEPQDEAVDAAAATRLHVVLVSFVTRRREYYSITNALALEDVIQRFDIVEVIVLASTPVSGRGASRSMPEYLALLPVEYATVLLHTLPLHMGPTANGEEDGKSVSVSGYTMTATERSAARGGGGHTGAGLDGAITAYLRPYKLDGVYAAMCASHGPSDATTTAPGKPQQAELSLPGSTLRALDVFHSSAGPQGSLLALLDHCVTACGSRKLRSWLAAPLADRDAILRRQAAVAFLLKGADDGRLEDMLHECGRVGDVEAIVGKLHAQRCGVVEFIRLLRLARSAHAMAAELLGGAAAEPPPALVAELLSRVASEEVRGFVAAHQAEIDTTATTPLELYTGKGSRMASAPAAIQEQLAARDNALKALDAELERVRGLLKLPGLEYRAIGGTPFLIDIPSGKADRVPKDWTVLTRTKTNVRYHTPTIIAQNIALCAAKDRLAAASARAWQEEQARLCAEEAGALQVLNTVIDSIATLDALRSLGRASARPGYVAPQLMPLPSASDGGSGALCITAGRHPVLDVLLRGSYVSCDVRLSAGGAWLLTGPNMGGKSALMRMIGCFVILAQLGCYVPAAAATLPVFSGLYCRMGSSDSILEGSSTFLTEMEETSRILRAPQLSCSLVLMDELGRGTSSFDGVAVAAATLEYLVARRVTTVFVTHYSYLCDPYVAASQPKCAAAGDAPLVECYYMGYREEVASPARGEAAGVGGDGKEESRLVFTYKPTKGVTPSSFGVAIAKMAGLPERVTSRANTLSEREERTQVQRMSLPIIAKFLQGNGVPPPSE